MTFREAIDWLYGTQMFGIKLGLDNMRRLLAALHLPAAGMKFIHTAGTNGKGSTCAMMDAILRSRGYRTGLFTSPHLITFRERIRVDGEMISEEAVAEGITAMRNLVADWDPHPTFFELATALALRWFEERGVEIAVMETGMGGRLDATNVLTPLVSVITPVSYDHQQWLGDTLAEIAGEKAGIIKPGVPVVCSPQEEEAMNVIRGTAETRNSPLTVVSAPLTADGLSLAGEHQRWNAAAAVTALRRAGLLDSDAIPAAALAGVNWPARFQMLEGGRLIIDGAHNPAGAGTAAAAWQVHFPGERSAMIFGAVAGKNHPEVLRLLSDTAAEVWFVTVDSARAVPAETLAEDFAAAGLPCHTARSLPEALAGARGTGRRVFICGSLYLCGEALALLESRTHEPSLQ